MDSIPRRQALKTLGVAGAGALLGVSQADAADTPIVVSGTPVQVVIEPISRETVRIRSARAPARVRRASGGDTRPRRCAWNR
jgi:hypothetical protein